MAVIKKPSNLLVFDLINESNPGLTTSLTPENCSLGTPAPNDHLAGSIQNTRIEVYPRLPASLIGHAPLEYRRLDFTTLFRAIELEVEMYSTAQSTGSPATFHQLLPYFNEKYGMSLQPEDVSNSAIPWWDDGARPGKRSNRTVVTANPKSLAYVGQFTVRWTQGRPELDNVIALAELQGRTYPGGNTFDSNHKVCVDLAAYWLDGSEISAGLESPFWRNYSIGNGTGIQGTYQRIVINWLNLRTGLGWSNAPTDQPFGLFGIKPVRYVLPNVAVPEAKGDRFNRLSVLTYPDTSTWGVGSLYIHYNA